SCPKTEAKRPAALGWPWFKKLRRLISLLFDLLVVLLHIFLVLVALFAGLALFMGGHAALVRAFLAFGFGFLAACLLLVFGLLAGIGSHRRTRENGHCAYHCAQGFDQFHSFVKTLARFVIFPTSLDLVRLPNRQPKDWIGRSLEVSN